MVKRRVLTFKAYPYFLELSRDGKKPFDIRLFDPDDPRFQALEDDWRQCKIKLKSTETGEWLLRTVKGYEHLPAFWGDWVVIYF